MAMERLPKSVRNDAVSHEIYSLVFAYSVNDLNIVYGILLAGIRGYHCLSGILTTMPSSSGVFAIWQQSLLFGCGARIKALETPWAEYSKHRGVHFCS